MAHIVRGILRIQSIEQNIQILHEQKAAVHIASALAHINCAINNPIQIRVGQRELGARVRIVWVLETVSFQIFLEEAGVGKCQIIKSGKIRDFMQLDYEFQAAFSFQSEFREQPNDAEKSSG